MKTIFLTDVEETGWIVEATTDLTIFSNFANREIRNTHVSGIRSSMEKEETGILYTPIYVNEDYKILDGQHRHKAVECIQERQKKLGKPLSHLHFIRFVGANLGNECVSTYNQNAKNWNIQDYIDYHVSRGNQMVIQFAQFVQTTSGNRFGNGNSNHLLTGITLLANVKTGKIKFSESDYLRAENMYTFLCLFKEAGLYFWNNATFVSAFRIFFIQHTPDINSITLGLQEKGWLNKYFPLDNLAVKKADREEQLNVFYVACNKFR